MSGQKVVISGSSGLIGRALRDSLREDGIEVVRLVRRPPRASDEVQWQPGQQPLDPEVLRGATAVINLGGASIGRLPWTRGYRRELAMSRLQSTRTLAEAFRKLGAEAPHFVSASAVGFYGDRPGEVLTEASGPGSTFLARLCVEWEREAQRAAPQARVALLRTAPVLHPDGVLKPLMILTKLGIAGPLGKGSQIWPWISLEDEVRAIRHVIDRKIAGPVNLSGPEPGTSNDIGRQLARQMRRPFLIPVPKWALRLILGRDVADSLLLADADVRPRELIETGFTFTHPTVGSAVAEALED